MKSFRIVFLILAIPMAAYARGPQQNAPKAAAPMNGFRAEFFSNLDEVEEKILDLADKTPADKFAWRPAPGVRSISEVYMHIAGGNYFLATFLGVPPPRTADLEKTVTKKADVIAELKRSFEHLRSAVSRTEDLEKQVKMFGNNMTTHRGVMMTMLSHLHEHLGQSIAYGRMNGVIPPWSR